MSEGNEALLTRLNKLETLLEINRELTLELDLDKLLGLIAAQASRVMDADRSSVYMVDAQKHEIWTRVAQGVDEIRMPADRGLAGQAAVTGEIVNVDDAYQAPGFDSTWDEKHGYTTRSMLCCPLRGRSGAVIGVFAVLNKRSGHFDADDEVLLQAMGSGVAVALENALLVDELRSANRKLSEAYDEVLSSEKLSVLGLLAGALAHDIQNPLAVILGNAEILLAKFPDDEDVAVSAGAIVRQSDRVSELIDSIQNYSRGNADTFAFVDIHRALRDALMLTERLMSKFHIRLRLDYAPDLRKAFGNANRLEQVFMNLIQNAVQAMDAQGEGGLSIATRNLERPDGRWVEVGFTDTGGGVPPERENDIFKPFFTTKSKVQGTGLGLAICQRIVRAHNGELVLQNRIGKGATFVVRIPAEDRRKRG